MDRFDRNQTPTLPEMAESIANPLFDTLADHLQNQCKARWTMHYSGEKAYLGWNVCFSRAGRTLCRVYPREGYFTVLIVIGRKEKERVEALLPQLSEPILTVYNQSREWMGQRWLMLDFTSADASFSDLLQLITIRMHSK